jgi:uncharacterized repeat protein (TIGR01451 family)
VRLRSGFPDIATVRRSSTPTTAWDQRLFHLVRYGVILLLTLFLASPQAASADGPLLVLDKSAYPSAVPSGGLVTYSITVANSGDVTAEGVTVQDALPDGFSYRPGSSQATVNGVTVSTADPAISGRTLTWSGLRLPSGRSDSFYGIHTFIQRRTESGYLDYQLNRSAELMGSGAYVTQLFDWIGTDWQGPQNWMRDFVGRAYDRWLTPVVRLAGPRGTNWIKPKPDPDGSYTTWAQAFKRVVEGLPRRDGHWLYVQIWNEPNLNEEWEGAANPAEYGRFLVDTAAAIRSLNDTRIVILNAPLSPGGEYYYLNYLEDMLNSVPAALGAFNVWASHPYPNNHPPDYNIHDGTAYYPDATIDVYQRELQVLARHGRSGVKVLLTETGYALYQADFIFEGYRAIDEANRADYIRRAFRDYWSQWPEVLGVCPYELVDPEEHWWIWDWLWDDGRSHQQYDTVKAMDKSYAPVSSLLQITFQATAASSAGTYRNSVSVSASNAPSQSATEVAPVAVYVPTPTPTTTPTQTPTSTHTPTQTATATVTGTPELTPTSTLTVTVTQTSPPTASPTLTTTETPAITPTVTSTETPTSTSSVTPSATIGPSETPTPTASPSPSPTAPFTPSPTATQTPTPTYTPSETAAPSLTPTPGCTDLIVDGGFEWDDEAWYIPIPGRADYSTSQVHSGQRSMRAGIEAGENSYSYSTFRQRVHVPLNAEDPVLSFWYYPVSGDTEHDLQYVLVEGEAGESDWALYTRSNAQLWTSVEYSLPPEFKGKYVTIYFGVLNDGAGGTTVMYVDDVSLPVCALQPTPSPTSHSPAQRVFLPLILRDLDWTGGRTLAGSTAWQAQGASPLELQTLWKPPEEQAASDQIHSVVLNPANNLLYVGVGEYVWAVDAKTGQPVAQIAVDAAPRGLAVDATNNRIYAALCQADALAVIDGAKNTLYEVIPGIPEPSGVAVGSDCVYVTATGSDELFVLDRQNCAIMKRIAVGDAPYALVLDPDRQRIYVGNAGSDTISIIDEQNSTQVNVVKLGGLGHPHGLALDPIRARLYVTYALSPKYRAIAAIDASSGEVLSRLAGTEKRPMFGAYGIAVDPLRGWVYTTTVDELLVLSGQTLQVLQAIPGAGPAYAFGLSFYAAERRLYVADARHGGLMVSGQ